MGFPGGSDGKESACNAGDLSWISGLGRSPGEGNGYPLRYSCLENSMTEDPGCKELDMTKRFFTSFHKWSITFKSCESLYYTLLTYVILYSSKTSMKQTETTHWRKHKMWPTIFASETYRHSSCHYPQVTFLLSSASAFSIRETVSWQHHYDVPTAGFLTTPVRGILRFSSQLPDVNDPLWSQNWIH